LVPFSSTHAIDMDALLAPQIRMVKLVSFSLEQQSAVFEVDVYNPNKFKLPVRELTGSIHLNNQLVSTLEENSEKSLAPVHTDFYCAN
jgi:LEA14-like dessication related protein